MTISRRSLFGWAGGAALGGAAPQAEAQGSGARNVAELERNKQVVRDYFDRCFNKGDLDFGRTIMVPDYNYHLLVPAPGRSGYDGWRRGVTGFRVAFPDCNWVIHQMSAEGDLVSVRTVWTATHSGLFMGVPASGKKVVAANADFYRMKDGKFVEHWDIPDYLAIMRQIGATVEQTAGYGGAIVP